MKQTQISSSLIVLVVLVIHAILGWLLANASFQKIQIDDSFENLQMVDINLDGYAINLDGDDINVDEGLDFAAIMEEVATSSSTVEPQASTESLPSTEMQRPVSRPQDFKATQVNTSADVVSKPVVNSEQQKIEPHKPQPNEHKPQPNEKKADVKEPVTNVVESRTTSQSKTLTHSASSQSSGQSSSHTNQTSNSKGANSSPAKSNGATGQAHSGNSAQENSVTKASLGAGYGSAMTGSCSDLSDEADDKGRVKLKVSVNEQGRAQNVQILSSSNIKRLDNQAKRIATNHTYSPAKSNGKAVADDVVFTIDFTCGNSA